MALLICAAAFVAGCGQKPAGEITVFHIAGNWATKCVHPFYVLTADDGQDHIRYAVVEAQAPQTQNVFDAAGWSPQWSEGEQFDYVDLQPNTTVTIHDKSVDKDFRISVSYVVDLDLGVMASDGAVQRAESLCHTNS